MLRFSVVKVASACGFVAIEIQLISKLFTFFSLKLVPEKSTTFYEVFKSILILLYDLFMCLD